MLKIIIGLVVLVLILSVLWFFDSRKEDPQEINMDKAEKIAEDWIKSNAPTYLHDGENLKLEKKEEIVKNNLYSFVFSFQSRSAGYGDRTDRITAQVITNHEIEVIVDNGQVVKAVTDQVYSEIEKRMISFPKPEVPVKVKVYFGKQEEMHELERTIPATAQIARATLMELIAGPTFDEKEEGYYSSINTRAEIQDLSISNGIAYVDFSVELERGVAGSTTVQFIRDQIEKTLLQFQTIDTVIISIDGRVDDILQP
jgi:hypothetical protein